MWNGFWCYRYLLWNLVSRDFKLKYRRSVLGVVWSVLNPLLMCLVYWAVFSSLMDMRGSGIDNFAVFLMCGQLLFNFFNEGYLTRHPRASQWFSPAKTRRSPSIYICRKQRSCLATLAELLSSPRSPSDHCTQLPSRELFTWKTCFFVQASDLGNLELYQVKLGVSRKQKSTFSKFRGPK